MQQFTVPQFIDVEDKIIGPITTRQFVIMLVGAGFIFVFYKIFDFSLFATLSMLVFAICIVLAFIKVNGMAMHFFLLNFMQTKNRPRLRVWDSAPEKMKSDYDSDEVKQIKKEEKTRAKIYTTSRLTELSLMVDTQGTYRGEAFKKIQMPPPADIEIKK